MDKVLEFTGKVAVVTLKIMIVAIAAGIATDAVISTGRKINGFIKDIRQNKTVKENVA